MPNKQDYIAALRMAIRQLHNCESVWIRTVPVVELFGRRIVWDGDVEVFEVFGHPKAKRAYAWAHLDGDKDNKTRKI